MTTRSVDLTSFLTRLDELEAIGVDGGTDAMATVVADAGARGEPLLMGRDPVSRYLCQVLPADHRVSCTIDICTVEKGPTHRPVVAAQWSLAQYPYVQTLLSMIEDLYFPELWELRP